MAELIDWRTCQHTEDESGYCNKCYTTRATREGTPPNSQLVCAFCLYAEDRKGQNAEPAITVMDGNATCDEHLSWRSMDAFLIEQSRIRAETKRP